MEMLFFLVVIGITILIFVVRHVIYQSFNIGADAISNAYKKKKNKEISDRSEKLSDRYK